MSAAAFKLEPFGPPPPCGFPKCTLEAFHDGDHLLAEKPDKRLAFPGPRYGSCMICGVKFVEYGDHSHPASRICDSKLCAIELLKRESPRVFPLMCACPQRPYPHELSVHVNVRREAYNPALRRLWPWSLSDRVEPSTEERRPA